MNAYHVRLKGRCLGPYALDRIREMTRRGEVGRTHEISTDGLSWAPATSFPEIFERAAPAPVPITTPAAAATPVVAIPEPAPVPVAPTSADGQWYHAHGGTPQGPMPRSQLVAMIQRGDITTTDYVFRDGSTDWVLAGDVLELAPAFGAGGAGNGQPGITAFCRECGSGLSQKAIMCPKCGAPTGAGLLPPPADAPLELNFPGVATRGRRAGGERKSKMVAAVLALVLGGLGVHHFYLGNPVLGIVYILFCWTFIPAIIAFVEAIVYLSMSDAAFDEKFNL